MDTVGPADVVNAVDPVGVVDAVGAVDVADTDAVEVADAVGRRRWRGHVHSGGGGHDQGEPGEMGKTWVDCSHVASDNTRFF